MSDKTGGPAFPIANAVFDADAPDAFEQFKAATSQSQGMSLRDYFAAHADSYAYMQFHYGSDPISSVTWRWRYADAMLQERAKP